MVALGKMKDSRIADLLCRVVYGELEWKVYAMDRKVAAKALQRLEGPEAAAAVEAFARNSSARQRP